MSSAGRSPDKGLTRLLRRRVREGGVAASICQLHMNRRLASWQESMEATHERVVGMAPLETMHLPQVRAAAGRGILS